MPNISISLFIFSSLLCFVYRGRGTFCAGTDCFYFFYPPHRSAVPIAGLFSPHGGVRHRRRGVFWFVRIISLLEPPPPLRGPPPQWGGINGHSPSQNGCALGKIKTNNNLAVALAKADRISMGFATILIQATNPDIPCAMYSSSGTDLVPLRWRGGKRAGVVREFYFFIYVFSYHLPLRGLLHRRRTFAIPLTGRTTPPS